MTLFNRLLHTRAVWDICKVALRCAYSSCLIVAVRLLKKVEHPWAGPPGVRWLLVARGVAGYASIMEL